MSKAVINGELHHVSPSQITTFEDCDLKWAISRVFGIEEPPPLDGDARVTGNRFHAQQEGFYEKGIQPTHPSCIAALSDPDVPPRHPLVIIEEPANNILGLTIAGVPMHGRIDLQVPPGGPAGPNKFLPGDTFKILDWKSTKNFDWLKTPEELARDLQGITYLKHGFLKWPDARFGIFQHVKLKTVGSGARSILTDPLPQDHVEEIYQSVAPIVERMKDVAKAEKISEVPFNKRACRKYAPKGQTYGCPFAPVCPALNPLVNLSFADAIDQENEDMTLSEKLKRNREAAGVAINPPDAAVPASLTKGQGEIADKPTTPEPETFPSQSEQAAENEPVVARPTTILTPAVGTVLYINCAELRGVPEVKRLEDEIQKRTPVIIEAHRKVNPKDVPEGAVDVREVKFGAGTASLVASFKKFPVTGNVQAWNEGLSAQVLEAILPSASAVVRGGGR